MFNWNPYWRRRERVVEPEKTKFGLEITIRVEESVSYMIRANVEKNEITKTEYKTYTIYRDTTLVEHDPDGKTTYRKTKTQPAYFRVYYDENTGNIKNLSFHQWGIRDAFDHDIAPMSEFDDLKVVKLAYNLVLEINKLKGVPKKTIMETTFVKD